jgi:hypothetical protein
MTREVLRVALETTETDGFTNTHFKTFQLSAERLFSPEPDVAIQEEDDEDELEEIEEYDEWDDDGEWEDDEWDDEEWEDDDEWDNEEWEDDEVDWEASNSC